MVGRPWKEANLCGNHSLSKCKIVYGFQPYMVKIRVQVFLQHRLCTSVIAVMWGSLIMWVGLMATLVDIASFPGPAQLFVACGMEKQGEPAIFSHVR